MKVSGRKPCLVVIAVTAAAMMAGCPLPFDYNGRGAGSSHTTDPSSPKMTVPVAVSYSEEGGTSGTIADGDSFASGKTTTVTLSTATDNAVIYYTDDGTTIASLSSAKKINGSSGAITVHRTTSVQSLDIHAVAIGPNMLPSQPVHATVGVSPYPILSVICDKVSTSEDGGTATFTITSSSQSNSDITVNLVTSGTYELNDVTSSVMTFPGPGTSFSRTLTQSTTTITIPITGQRDVDGDNEKVILTIQPDPNSPPAYTVGAPASTTVEVLDNQRPELTIARSVSPISDNGGVTVFTVTSSFALSSDLTVNLLTGGTYETSDVSGMPGPGSTFALTFPAGQLTASRTVTAQTDPGEFDNETVTLSIVASGAYSIGTPGSATLSITDTSPIPALTLTADRGSMTDGQTATFTVTASVAPDANHTVNIVSTNYTVGKVLVPANVTILAGATSAQFQVSAPAQVGYEVQNPQVSLVSGTGHTLGFPNGQSLQIYDDALGVFEWDGVWSFNTGMGSNVGTGASWSITGSVPLSGGALNFSGIYDPYPGDAATVSVTNASADFNKNLFTLAVSFKMADLNFTVSRAIIVGGTSYRWLIAQVDPNGNLSVDFNNHGIIDSNPVDPAYNLDLGMTISAGTTYTLVLNVDVATRTLTAWLNGTMVTRALPSYFVWANPTGDEVLTSTDYSRGRAFKGTWDWVFAANGLLDYNEVLTLITSDPDL